MCKMQILIYLLQLWNVPSTKTAPSGGASMEVNNELCDFKTFLNQLTLKSHISQPELNKSCDLWLRPSAVMQLFSPSLPPSDSAPAVMQSPESPPSPVTPPFCCDAAVLSLWPESPPSVTPPFLQLFSPSDPSPPPHLCWSCNSSDLPPPLLTDLSLSPCQHGRSRPVLWDREAGRCWVRVQWSSRQVNCLTASVSWLLCFVSSLEKSTLSCCVFVQSLHETDPGGAALLPRQQRHPPRRQGIYQLQVEFHCRPVGGGHLQSVSLPMSKRTETHSDSRDKRVLVNESMSCVTVKSLGWRYDSFQNQLVLLLPHGGFVCMWLHVCVNTLMLASLQSVCDCASGLGNCVSLMLSVWINVSLFSRVLTC